MKFAALQKSIIILGSCFIPRASVRKQWRETHLSKLNSSKVCVDLGLGNSLFIVDKNGVRHKVDEIPGLRVVFQGSNSVVEVYSPYNFFNCVFHIGDRSFVSIKSTKFAIKRLSLTKMTNSKLIIGENFSCTGCDIENHDETGLDVKIGDDCQFSYGIHIRTSDGHAIYDDNTKEILNVPKTGVTIGNHVWVGMNAIILKDVSIADNVVVGAGALICKSCEERNVIFAGVPAKIIKRGVNWDRRNTEQIKHDNNLASV